MILKQLKSTYIHGIYDTKSLLIQDESFQLQSGRQSHIYLNHRNFLSRHQYLTLIAQLYKKLAEQIQEDYVLGAVDSMMSPIIVGAMSSIFSLDYVVIRKKPLSHGVQDFIFGQMSKQIVLIDDMSSTGETLLDSSEKVREKRGIIKYAIISAYREPTVIQNLAAEGITLLSIASFDEIINHLKYRLTPDETKIINQKPLIFG